MSHHLNKDQLLSLRHAVYTFAANFFFTPLWIFVCLCANLSDTIALLVPAAWTMVCTGFLLRSTYRSATQVKYVSVLAAGFGCFGVGLACDHSSLIWLGLVTLALSPAWVVEVFRLLAVRLGRDDSALYLMGTHLLLFLTVVLVFQECQGMVMGLLLYWLSLLGSLLYFGDDLDRLIQEKCKRGNYGCGQSACSYEG